MPRPKKSVETIVAEGKTHLTKDEIEKRREEESEIIGKADNLKCPAFLMPKKMKKSDIKNLAEQEFNRVVDELKELNIIANLDLTMLSIYANAYANYVVVTNQLKNENLTIEYTNKQGHTNLIENPLVKTQMKYIDVIMKCSTKLGLSVSDRLKLVVPKQDKPKSKIEEEFGDI